MRIFNTTRLWLHFSPLHASGCLQAHPFVREKRRVYMDECVCNLKRCKDSSICRRDSDLGLSWSSFRRDVWRWRCSGALVFVCFDVTRVSKASVNAHRDGRCPVDTAADH